MDEIEASALINRLKGLFFESGKQTKWISADILRKLEGLEKCLKEVIEFYKLQSMDALNPESFLNYVRKLITISKTGIHNERFVFKSNDELNQAISSIIHVLESLTGNKELTFVGKGLETEVKQSSFLFSSLSDKVIKRLYETEDQNLVEEHRRIVSLYEHRMNSIHPGFKVWPIELKVVKTENPKTGKDILTVYAIQKKFDNKSKFRYVLPSMTRDQFLALYRVMIYAILSMMFKNRTDSTEITFDPNRDNTIFVNGSIYLYDYHNPLLKFRSNDNKVFQRIVTLMMKPKKASEILIRKINKECYIRQRGTWLKPLFLLSKATNTFHKCYNEDLRTEYRRILSEEIAKFDFPASIKKKASRIHIGWYEHNIIHGEIFSGSIQAEKAT